MMGAVNKNVWILLLVNILRTTLNNLNLRTLGRAVALLLTQEVLGLSRWQFLAAKCVLATQIRFGQGSTGSLLWHYFVALNRSLEKIGWRR